MKTIRNTYQKELVLSDVMNRYDHPTAQMVFELAQRFISMLI